MGVGAIGDDGIDGIDHALRHIAVQIERRNHGHVWPDHFTNHGKNLAVWVLGLGGNHRAVVADVNRIHGHRGLEARFHRIKGELKEPVFQRAACFDQPNQDRHRRPLALRVHFLRETAQLRRQHRIAAAEVLQDFVTGKVNAIEKVSFGRHRCKAVAFEH